MINRADRVNDVFCREAVAFGDFRLTCRTSAKRAAFLKELSACCTVNRAVYTTASQQTRIRGINDGINGLLRDVALDDLNLCHCGSNQTGKLVGDGSLRPWLEEQILPYFAGRMM
jgi:hypothetical protein